MMGINVAVLMATHNGAKFIENQILSILRQQDVVVNLYIGDDNSTDGTIEIINKLSLEYNNINFIGTAKFGTAGLNFLSILSEIKNPERFDFFAFSDQDDLWLPFKLKSAVADLIEKQADGFSSNFLSMKLNGDLIEVDKSYCQRKFDYILENIGPGCTMVFTKKLFYSVLKSTKEINIKHIYFHDWFVYFIARSHGNKWITSKQANIIYRQHANNVLGFNTFNFFSIKKRFLFMYSDHFKNQFHAHLSLLKKSSSSGRWDKSFFLKKFTSNPFSFRRQRRHFIFIILNLRLIANLFGNN